MAHAGFEVAALSYIALTWAWGDCVEKKIIIVDGPTFTITAKAFELFRRVRAVVRP